MRMDENPTQDEDVQVIYCGKYGVKWVRYSFKSLIVVVLLYVFSCYSIYAVLEIVSPVIQISWHVNACL